MTLMFTAVLEHDRQTILNAISSPNPEHILQQFWKASMADLGGSNRGQCPPPHVGAAAVQRSGGFSIGAQGTPMYAKYTAQYKG